MDNVINKVLAVVNDVEALDIVLKRAVSFSEEKKAMLEVLFVHEEKMFALPDFFRFKETPEKDVVDKDKIKKERVRIDSIKRMEAIENQGYYNSYLELTVSVDSFIDMVLFIISYGPSSIELIKPQKTELSQNEMQEILHQMSSAVYYYTSLIIQLRYADLVKKAKEEQEMK